MINMSDILSALLCLARSPACMFDGGKSPYIRVVGHHSVVAGMSHNVM